MYHYLIKLGTPKKLDVLMKSESMEMYLETIYLLEKSEGHAHVVEIGRELGISKAGVTKASNQLKRLGYIFKEPYGSITLTEKGRKSAKEIYLKHKKISQYLASTLDIDMKEAEKNACRLEHIISENMYSAICSYLDKNNITFI